MIVALLLNIDIEEITLLPFGAIAKYKGNINLIQEFLIAIAGPIASLFFAVIYNNDIYFKVNLLIVFLNILPIYPLDGGRILKVLLIKIFKAKLGAKINYYINKSFIVILICFALYMALKYNNYAFLILSIYILKIWKDQIQKEKIQELINYLQINK